MYTELHIEYSSTTQDVSPITIRYKLTDFPITQKWAERLNTALAKKIPIDHPERFYGFNSMADERSSAVAAINKCCEVIDSYKPGFVGRRVNESKIEQDTLNYLHNIFEQYHGTLNKPHPFFINAPEHVKEALAQLNLEVHRCEGLVDGAVRQMLPSHMVTYYGLEKNSNYLLELEDYEHFTDFTEFGTVYLLYAEIGKTLQDLALDHDTHVHEDAYKPFRHYTADFVVRMYGSSQQSWIKFRKLYKQHYDENKEYYLSKGYDYSHPYNRPGNIPLAKMMNTPIDVVREVAKRQQVSSVKLF